MAGVALRAVSGGRPPAAPRLTAMLQRRLRPLLLSLLLLLPLQPARAASTASWLLVDDPLLPRSAIGATALPSAADLEGEAAGWSQFFASGKAAAAKASFDAGRLRQALTELDALPPAPEVGYLQALVLQRLGRGAEAAARFVTLEKQLPELASRCRFHAAVGFEDADKLDEAEAAFASVEEGSPLRAEARLGLARVRLARKDTFGAYEALAPIANRSSTWGGRDWRSEALWQVMQVAKQRKENDTARLAAIRLWTDHPLVSVGDQALALTGGGDPGDAAKLVRAENLLEANRNEASLLLLGGLSTRHPLTADVTSCRIHFALGKAWRKQRKHAPAIEKLRAVAEACKADPGQRIRALYVAGQSATASAPELGIALYRTIADEAPTHAFADDALLFAAELSERVGKLDQAREFLARLVEGKGYRGGDHRAEGMFRLAWMERTRGDHAAALSLLERLLAEHGDGKSAELERAEFWRSRELDLLGRGAEATEALVALTLAHPGSYYALLARSRLHETDPLRAVVLEKRLGVVPQPAAAPAAVAALAEHPGYRAARVLHRLGLDDAAQVELAAIARPQLEQAGGEEAIRGLVEGLFVVGNPRLSQAIARVQLRSLLAGPFRSADVGLWRAAYPQAFREEIESSCEAAEVKPDLFQALVREESALDPHAVSWAGAVGLSQLMVPTAKEVAAKLHITSPIDTETLQEPSLNLRLGSTYIGGLLDRFQGNPALALAAYNAGAGAVNRWLKARPGLELDAWVEEIPVVETRNYVKRVLTTFSTYQLLYAGDASARLPRLPLEPNAPPRPRRKEKDKAKAPAPAPKRAAG